MEDDQVDELASLYWTLYPIEPETAVQFNCVEEEVRFVELIPVGIVQAAKIFCEKIIPHMTKASAKNLLVIVFIVDLVLEFDNYF